MPEWIVPVIIAAIGSPLAVKSFDLMVRQLTGREARKRSDIDKAWAARDVEARQRRKLAESLHETRLLAREYGVPLDKLPPWPDGTGSIKTGDSK